jgi:hypothetical protein
LFCLVFSCLLLPSLLLSCLAFSFFWLCVLTLPRRPCFFHTMSWWCQWRGVPSCEFIHKTDTTSSSGPPYTGQLFLFSV